MTSETRDVLALLFGALGLVGGVVGFFRAVAASRQAAKAEIAAQDARSDAAAALVRSADATERIAKAIEIISARPAAVHLRPTDAPAELRALVPSPEVKWAIEERTEGDTYRLRNVGSIAARDVRVATVPKEHAVLARMDADRPTLEPGSAIVVRTERRLTLRVKELDIAWLDDTSAEMQHASLYLP